MGGGVPAPRAGPGAGCGRTPDSGFIGPADRRTQDRLSSLGGDALNGMRLAFGDAWLQELFPRNRDRNFTATLGGAEPASWLQHCQKRLHDGAGGGLTLAQFRERIDALSKTADQHGEVILAARYRHQGCRLKRG